MTADGVLAHALYEVLVTQTNDCDELAIFNTAHYVATLAIHSPAPNLHMREWKKLLWQNIGDRQYFGHIGDDPGVQLVMSMAYVLLSVQPNRTDAMARLLDMMEREDYAQSGCFAAFAKLLDGQVKYHADLRHFTSADEIKKASSHIDWRNVTKFFEPDAIRELVGLMPGKRDKRMLLDMIERHRGPFDSLLYGDDMPSFLQSIYAEIDAMSDDAANVLSTHTSVGSSVPVQRQSCGQEDCLAIGDIVYWAENYTSSAQEAQTIQRMLYHVTSGKMSSEVLEKVGNIGQRFCVPVGSSIKIGKIENRYGRDSCHFGYGSTQNGSVGCF
ncbi:MAG: hypothetical protein K6E73_01435 [Bacteroidales bacterium]|nr:hypothetical protein [Bacteroidales bacterium]